MQFAHLFNAPVICVIICLILPIKIDGQAAEKVQNNTLIYKCDIVLILDDSLSIKRDHHGGEANFERMLGVVRKFPDYFLMGEHHTRVAVIVFSSDSRVLLNLTPDDKLVRNFSTEATWGGTSTHLALTDAKEKVFANSRPDAMRIVILITDGWPNDMAMAQKASKDLRDEDTQIYVAFIGEWYHNDPGTKDHIENVTGDPSNIFPIGDFDNLTAAIYDKVIHEIKCKYHEGCRFDDSSRQSCAGEYWRAPIGDTNCTNSPPSKPPNQCMLEDCKAMCNRWPWEDRECQDEDAGKNLTIKRGPKPDGYGRMFEHCPMENVKMCLLTTESLKSTEPLNLPSTEKIAVAETESSLSVVTKWWFMLVMVIIALLILTGIVVGIISVNRKRKKAKEAALMEKKKATAEKRTSSDPPSTIDHKSRPKFNKSGAAADHDLESPSGRGSMRGQMNQFGYEQGQAADHCFQVSLATDLKGRSQKKTSSSGKSISSSMKNSASKKVCDVKRAKKKSIV